MRLTLAEYLILEARQAAKSNKIAGSKTDETKESAIHVQIMDFCNQQWPRWKFLRGRMDKRSTIQVGAQDFTIFMPRMKTLCVECKARGKKRSAEQAIWAKEMAMIEHPVHLVYSFDDFLKLLKPNV